MVTQAHPTPDPTTGKPPRPRRWIPVSVKMFAAVLGLLLLGSLLRIGLPIYRQQAATREIERLGGNFGTKRGGPEWLREWLGDEWMKLFDTVTNVNLSNTKASDGTMGRLCWLTSLQTLYLDRTQITDAGLARMKASTALKDLSLDSTRITDMGLAHLTELRVLEKLSLSGTQITDAGLARLKSLTSLKLLHIARTRTTDGGIADLKQVLPMVSVWKLAERDRNEPLFDLKSFGSFSMQLPWRQPPPENASGSRIAMPNDDFLSAIVSDDEGAVARNIDGGADVDADQGAGQTPLMFAAWSGKSRIVELLLSAGAAVDARDEHGRTPLHCAVGSDVDEETSHIADILLAANAPVDAADDDGETALHSAAANDDPERMRVLLASGAQPNAVDKAGRTPLMHAVEARDRTQHLYERVGMLIENGADPNLRDNDGKTALQLAQERLTFISSPELGRKLDESFAGFRRMVDESHVNARTAADLNKKFDDQQRASQGSIADAKKNLPIVIRMLQKLASK